MKMNLFVKFAVATAVFLPALSHASSRLPNAEGSLETVICGEIFNTNSPYGQEDQEATGYVVRMDCNLDKETSLKDPRAIVQSISPAHKGVVTKFTNNAVQAAAAANEANPRSKKAYACMAVTMDSNPCVSGANKANILQIHEMHAAESVLGKWMNKARVASQE